jgi:O-antigen ligase
MPSFAGYHDFATLSGLTLALALGAIVLGHPRSLRPAVWVAAVSGTAGAIIGGALSTVIALLLGIAFAASAMLVRRTATRTRAAVLVAVAATLLAGSAAMRSGDIADFVSFLGSGPETTETDVQTYSQRTVLAYIGIRIFLDHPLFGVGWQASGLPVNFERYVADVRRRFPEVSDEAIPSAKHPWGVQNAYVQAAADMGIAGLLVTVWLALAGVVRAGRATFSPSTRSSQLALATTVAMLVCAFEWAALGLVAGAPATAFVWLALGASIAVAVRCPGTSHAPRSRTGRGEPPKSSSGKDDR